MPDPLWINAPAPSGDPAYNANELRTAMTVPLPVDVSNVQTRQGVPLGLTNLDTVIDGFTATVRAGRAVMNPALTTTQGPYWVSLPTDEIHPIPPGDAVNPRIDITILRVYDDDEDGSGMRLARSELVTGAPAITPAKPAVPPGAMELAEIDVPADGQGDPVGTITYPFVVANGGILPVRDTADQATVSPLRQLIIARLDQGLFYRALGGSYTRFGEIVLTTSGNRPAHADGQTIYETDTNRLWVSDGAQWTLPNNVAGGRVGRAILESNSAATADGATLTWLAFASPLTPVSTGRIWKITARANAVSGSSGNDRYFVDIQSNGTPIARTQVTIPPVTDNTGLPELHAIINDVPMIPHTFSATMFRVQGSGSALMRGESGLPRELLVEDIGSTSAGLAT